jgi:hypothetical protein
MSVQLNIGPCHFDGVVLRCWFDDGDLFFNCWFDDGDRLFFGVGSMAGIAVCSFATATIDQDGIHEDHW